MTWINVKDELPIHLQEIKFKGHFPFICQGFFEKNENGYCFFNKNIKENKINLIYGVTHWMPLTKALNQFERKGSQQNVDPDFVNMVGGISEHLLGKE